MKAITISDVNKKRARIIVYLLASGILGYVVSWLLDKPELAVILTPTINFTLYSIQEELNNEGYVKALEK